MLSGDTIARVAYRNVPLPMCILDDACRLVELNACALDYWGLGTDASGLQAPEALRLVGPDGEPDGRERLALAVRTGGAVGAAVCHGPRLRPVILVGAPVCEGDRTFTLLTVLDRDRTDPAPYASLPAWTRTDALTGLVNRRGWHTVAADWDGAPGVAVCLRLDHLEAINERHGRAVGDAVLAALADAVRSAAPPDGLALRVEGNVFALLLPRTDVGAAEAWLRATADALTQTTPQLSAPPRLRHGVATWQPGGLDAALQNAAAGLQASLSVALTASSGGRILLTGTASPAPAPPSLPIALADPGGNLAGLYIQWHEQADQFVTFADPPCGGAVVEVGAGAGRITFDGQLAQRVGPAGALLVTDTDPRRLERARSRATGMAWLHFLRASAESLPLASGTVDMAVGALFLHLCDGPRAIREMARILRPGGRLAIAAALEFPWSPFWTEVLEPIRLAHAAVGRALPQPLLAFGELEGMLQSAGLVLERAEVSAPQQISVGDAPTALAVWRRLAIPKLLLAGLDPAGWAGHLAKCEARIVSDFDRVSARLRALEWRCLSVVARRPV